MIDIETEVFEILQPIVLAAYPDALVVPEEVRQSVQFPAVSIVQMDNLVYPLTMDSGSIEHDAEVVFEINVYSNLLNGKKAECKAIMTLIDDKLTFMGFRRMFLNPTPNMNDATIYRMTGRYRALVSKDKTIYRRR